MISRGCVIKRLYADGIAGEEQKVPSEIHDGESKDALEFLHARGTDFLVQMHDDFGVGVRRETMAARFKARAQLLEVIDLSIEDEPNRRIFIGHGLVAGRRYVDDGKSI